MSTTNLLELKEDLGHSLCCYESGSGQCDLLANDLGLCCALIFLLAEGQPVSARVLARVSGRSLEDVLAVIRASSSVELDDDGHIVGAGLSLRRTPHRLSVDGRLLYAWCALDALMYPPLLNITVEVESPCAVTGAPVRVRVSSAGVEEVTPAEAVVSFLKPEGTLGVRQGFCNNVHFFRSTEVAAAWLNAHAAAQLLTVSEAYLLGRQLANAKL